MPETRLKYLPDFKGDLFVIASHVKCSLVQRLWECVQGVFHTHSFIKRMNYRVRSLEVETEASVSCGSKFLFNRQKQSKCSPYFILLYYF